MSKKETAFLDIETALQELFSLLSESEKESIKGCYTIEHYKKGEVIYNEEEIPSYLMVLVKGKVKIHKDGVGGRCQIMRMMKPGEYFGYRAWFAKEPYITSASACEATSVLLIPMEIISDIMQINPLVGIHFVNQLSIDLGIADARVVNLTQKHIRGRLAESLLFLKKTYGVEDDGITLNIYLAREDLANLSNMTTPNAIRTLSHFVNEKLIIVDGRRIKVLDEERLIQVSRQG